MSDEARTQRFTKDAALMQPVNLPAAGASIATPSIDLGATEPGQLVNEFDVLVEVPATPDLVEAKTLTLTLRDSADGENFTSIEALAAKVVTGAAEAAGGDAVELRVKLPTTVRRYIDCLVAVQAGGGNNTDVIATLSIVS